MTAGRFGSGEPASGRRPRQPEETDPNPGAGEPCDFPDLLCICRPALTGISSVRDPYTDRLLQHGC